MVLVNDIQLQVVSADEKIPFKEHRKGLDTFVEVEPGAEYFLSVQRVRLAFKGRLVCRARVDGERVPYRVFLEQMCDNSSIHYIGIPVFSHDTKIRKALRFVTAPVTTYTTDERSAIAASGTSGMGKIELDVSEVIKMERWNFKSIPYKECFSATPSITVENEAFITRNKNVRSINGNYTYSKKRNKDNMKRVIKKEKLLYTITLHYCATPGLIAVGVLPKPPLWQYQRQFLFPERLSADQKLVELDKMNVVSVTHNCKGIEVIEIHDDDGDADSTMDNEESKSDGNDEQPFKPSTLPPKFSARANAIFYG